MITLRRASDRGHAEHGWLKSYHTFSFASYQDPEHMGFRDLRVINEDFVQPGKGFDTHSHEDMEIVTYVLEGALEHKDSMGNGSVIRPGGLQRMTAGTGVMHSEFNPSDDTPAHLLQIWLFPEENGLQPGYEQKLFAPELKHNQWCLVGSRDGRDGSLTIHQDVNLYSSSLQESHSIDVSLDAARRGFLQIARGSVTMNGEELVAGDAATLQGEAALTLVATQSSELLLFDMA